MKTQSPPVITATGLRIYGVHQRPVIRGKVFRRAAVTALAAALLAGTATPAVAAADSRVAVLKAAADSNAAVLKAADGQDRPELREAMQAFVDAGFAGVQVRVHDEQGEWVGSAGVRKLGQSVKPPTNGRFWAGSVSKTFTATLVLQLVAEGKIGLDTPVAGYLPEFGLDRRITVRMLLQHTSGLFNYTGEYYDNGTVVPGIPATGDEWLNNRFRSYQPEELIRLALSKPPRFEPGTGQNYANTNYTLALLLIEKVSGRSYAEEMQRRILRPLGLKGTMAAGNRTQLPGPHAHGYYRYRDAAGQQKVVDISRQNLSLLAGAGDLISTTQDLHTFISALNGGKLLPANLLAEMRKPHPKMGYGLGLFVQDLGPNCGTVYQHNGSPPHGYGALMYSSPDGRTTVTGSVTWVDEATRGPAAGFEKLLGRLVKEVFCDGQTAG
ncbi:serine hydrolase domain-containing protein [Nonomuraea turcica]|uniref:serine hydrolase domain-containing protein n=1 Tax=Nonomuraea sp. G32 TaxID=3067274 RepID=UPI00273AA5FB|nr:serine hydrolase domain-containing protein [Nonomuraea sp. G32]MDP4500937.1 serine hydrolase domain-containing protein [Nonomuraea sp. G32]